MVKKMEFNKIKMEFNKIKKINWKEKYSLNVPAWFDLKIKEYYYPQNTPLTTTTKTPIIDVSNEISNVNDKLSKFIYYYQLILDLLWSDPHIQP